MLAFRAYIVWLTAFVSWKCINRTRFQKKWFIDKNIDTVRRKWCYVRATEFKPKKQQVKLLSNGRGGGKKEKKKKKKKPPNWKNPPSSSPHSKAVPNQKSANTFSKHWEVVTLQLLCSRVRGTTATNEDAQARTGGWGCSELIQWSENHCFVKRKSLPWWNQTCISYQKGILWDFATEGSNLLEFNTVHWELMFKIDIVDINLHLVKM